MQQLLKPTLLRRSAMNCALHLEAIELTGKACRARWPRNISMQGTPLLAVRCSNHSSLSRLVDGDQQMACSLGR